MLTAVADVWMMFNSRELRYKGNFSYLAPGPGDFVGSLDLCTYTLCVVASNWKLVYYYVSIESTEAREYVLFASGISDMRFIPVHAATFWKKFPTTNDSIELGVSAHP